MRRPWVGVSRAQAHTCVGVARLRRTGADKQALVIYDDLAKQLERSGKEPDRLRQCYEAITQLDPETVLAMVTAPRVATEAEEGEGGEEGEEGGAPAGDAAAEGDSGEE